SPARMQVDLVLLAKRRDEWAMEVSNRLMQLKGRALLQDPFCELSLASQRTWLLNLHHARTAPTIQPDGVKHSPSEAIALSSAKLIGSLAHDDSSKLPPTMMQPSPRPPNGGTCGRRKWCAYGSASGGV
ncbi:MAG: hypothetical protein ACK56I_30410, partial [bacterium]